MRLFGEDNEQKIGWENSVETHLKRKKNRKKDKAEEKEKLKKNKEKKFANLQNSSNAISERIISFLYSDIHANI